jgi:NAD(P)-dependent dehydrogenase (short-subunit alcohol dehydrogenase family)
VDVGDEHAVKTNVGRVFEIFGKVDILINCAGFEQRLKLERLFGIPILISSPLMTILNISKHMLSAINLMNLAVIPSMQKNHFGRVVNITSVIGVNGGFQPCLH